MKHFKLFVFLFMGIFMAAGSDSLASKPGELIWWEFETAKENPADENDKGGMAAFLNREKRLILHKGTFPISETGESKPGLSSATGNASIWIRNPDGAVSKANIAQGTGSIALNLPSDLNPGDLSGRYLIGVHLDAGVMDIDSDGRDEKVHLYSKYLVNYSKKDGIKGKKPDTFFREGDKLALEIGPALTKSIFKSAGCPHSNVIKGKGNMNMTSYVSDGTTQAPLKDYKMNVLFKGEPLANTEVLIFSQSGWNKTVMTDSEGAISFTPPNTLERSPESGGRGGFHGMPPSAMGKMKDKDKAGADTAGNKAAFDSPHPGHHRDGDASEKGKAGTDKAGKGMPAHVRSMMQTAGDKLLYMVAYKDPSTGEYHCATLPVSLRGSMTTDAGTSGKVSGFTLWGIIGAGLCSVGLGGSAYHRKRRNRDTIFRSDKS